MPMLTGRGTARRARGRIRRRSGKCRSPERRSPTAGRAGRAGEHAQADLQDDEQHNAFQRRFVELAGMARQRSPARGNTIAQGTSVTRPHNSPLTKLARRPKNSPIGAKAQRPDRRPTAAAACGGGRTARPRRTTPSRPPWNDMPPSQAAISCIGLVTKAQRQAAAEIGVRRNAAQDDAIDQVPAQPAAQDDAERRPDHQVADLVLGGRRLAVEGRVATATCWRRHPHHRPPAQQQRRRYRPAHTSGWRSGPRCSSTGSIWG